MQINKVAIVTGANSGIGRVTARELALQGYHVFLACRSEDKAQVVLAEISQLSQGKAKAEFLPLDLADLASVKHCVQLFLSKNLPLHLLVCNAGLSGSKGVTKSGFELTFGVCHIGHFYLTNLLLEKLKESAPARVVVVASMMHRHVQRFNVDWVKYPTRSPAGLKEYAHTKLANILFVKELALRLQGTGVTAYALHPGIVASDIWRSVPWPFNKAIKRFMLTVEEGAKTTLYCATNPQVSAQSGFYYDKAQIASPSVLAEDTQAALKLWQMSAEWTGIKY